MRIWDTPLEGILKSHGLAWIKNIHYHHCHDPFFMLGYNRSSCPGLGQWASGISSLELWISEFSVRKYGGKKGCSLSWDYDKRSPSKWSQGKKTWGLNLNTKTCKTLEVEIWFDFPILVKPCVATMWNCVPIVMFCCGGDQWQLS